MERVLFVLLGLFQAVLLRTDAQIALCVVIGILALWKARKLPDYSFIDEKNFSFTLLGFCLPAGAFFGSGFLLCVACVVFFVSEREQKSGQLTWAFPFLLLIAGWTLASWVFFSGGGPIFDQIESWKMSPSTEVTQSISLLRYCVMVVLFSLFSNDINARKFFLKGLTLGLIPALALTSYQVFFPESSMFLNRSWVWVKLDRLTGTFSDPNAFGLFVVLLVPVIAGLVYQETERLKKGAYISVLVWWVLLAPFAGSRSFFLGILLLLLVMLFLYRWRVGLLVSLLGVALLFGIQHLVPAIQANESFALLPSGVQRFIQALHISSYIETFFSRTIFFDLSWQVWQSHPVVGVGFQRFPEFVVPYAQFLGLPLGVWTDNPNSFYLAILAELGIVGLLLLCLSLSRLAPLRNLETVGKLSLAGCITFFLLLAIGPHLYFDEIAILFSLLASQCFYIKRIWNIRKFTRWLAWSIPTVALVVVIGVQYQRSDRGFFPWEKEGRGYFRWTRRTASSYVLCDNQANALLQVRSLSNKGSRVDIVHFTKEERVRSFDLLPGKLEKIRFRCELPNTWLRYEIQVKDRWVPAYEIPESTDSRMLGVQVIGSEVSNLARL